MLLMIIFCKEYSEAAIKILALSKKSELAWQGILLRKIPKSETSVTSSWYSRGEKKKKENQKKKKKKKKSIICYNAVMIR